MFVPIHEDEYPKLTAERLMALQLLNLPRMKGLDVLAADPDAEDQELQVKLMAVADEYFQKFVKAPKKGRCINCDRPLANQLFGGTFMWSLAHGEGHCGLCGYPARGIHRIEGVGSLSNYVLQYHPDGLSIGTKEELVHER